jgi:hypothetical protein
LSVVNSFRVLVCHNFTVSSSLAEASVLPSGEKATENTEDVYPLSVANFLVRASEILIGTI